MRRNFVVPRTILNRLSFHRKSSDANRSIETMKNKHLLLIFFCYFLIIGHCCWKQCRKYIPSSKLPPEQADIFIQAGHEGRTKGSTGAQSKYGKEIEWTPIVSDEATRLLREAGYTVIRANADRRRKSQVQLAISIHFDGSATPCRTGASIGYDDPTDKPAADAWRKLYQKHFQYRWMPDNFTKNLKHYYNYHYTITSDAELLLELGDITCKEQALWLKPRLKKLGALVAYFASERVEGKGKSKVRKVELGVLGKP